MDFIIDSNFDEKKKHWNTAISGEIDIFSSDKMKTALLELINQQKADLHIDCKNLEYIDSTALGALVVVLKNVKVYSGEVHLLNIRPNLAKLFKITNLDKVFVIEGDANE